MSDGGYDGRGVNTLVVDKVCDGGVWKSGVMNITLWQWSVIVMCVWLLFLCDGVSCNGDGSLGTCAIIIQLFTYFLFNVLDLIKCNVSNNCFHLKISLFIPHLFIYVYMCVEIHAAMSGCCEDDTKKVLLFSSSCSFLCTLRGFTKHNHLTLLRTF